MLGVLPRDRDTFFIRRWLEDVPYSLLVFDAEKERVE